NPALNARMLEVLDELEGDERCGVLFLRGAGESWSAGMDLKEYFRDNDYKPRNATLKARRQSGGWLSRLMYFEKPLTMAIVGFS
ncbi:p-hydroxycinnamoyl CoA hydratase/lyase, partial [Rhizobium ruizarguesonis]